MLHDERSDRATDDEALDAPPSIRFVGGWHVGSRGFTPDGPSGIAVDAEGLVFVATTERRCIEVYTRRGDYVATYGDAFVVPDPVAVALDPDGRMVIVGWRSGAIAIIDRDGDTVASWGSSDGPDRLIHPRAAAVDRAGHIFVCDTKETTLREMPCEHSHRVHVFTPDGRRIGCWGGPGVDPGRFDRPSGIAIGPDDLVYVADTFNQRVQVFSPDGEFVRMWPVGEPAKNSRSAPAGIAIDHEGRAFVTDISRDCVEIYSAEGGFIASFGAPPAPRRGFRLISAETWPTPAGELDSPCGISIGPDGRAYVMDTDNNRVQVFEPWSIAQT